MDSPFMPNKKPHLGKKFGSGMDLNSPLPKPGWQDDSLDRPPVSRHASANRIHDSGGKGNPSIFSRFGGTRNYMSNSNFSYFNNMGMNKQEPKPQTTRSGWNPNLLKPQQPKLKLNSVTQMLTDMHGPKIL